MENSRQRNLLIGAVVVIIILIVVIVVLLATRPEEAESTTPTPVEETAMPTDTPVPAAAEKSTLATTLERGAVRCGVNQELLGFGLLNPDTGEIEGFDVDFCHAFAAAIFGDASAVELVPVTAQTRLEALSAGEYDVLIRNTTYTLTRDTDNGLDFAPTTFYDGQSIMVRADSGLNTWDDLDGVSICTTSGTTTELNITSKMESLGLNYELLAFESTADTQAGFVDGRCDVQTSDRSQLLALRESTDNPAEYVVWELVFSKEPLGPVYRHGDDQWGNLIDWVTYGTFQAEEFGLNMDNVADYVRADGESDEDYVARVGPEIARFLDASLGIGSKLGVSNDFMVAVLTQVGSYADIFDRHLGAKGLGWSRGDNELWTNGGLIYSPAWR
jgi:general L-amino acid transport system substrate-binding protein